jgi:hypothetical protein
VAVSSAFNAVHSRLSIRRSSGRVGAEHDSVVLFPRCVAGRARLDGFASSPIRKRWESLERPRIVRRRRHRGRTWKNSAAVLAKTRLTVTVLVAGCANHLVRSWRAHLTLLTAPSLSQVPALSEKCRTAFFAGGPASCFSGT